MSRFLPTEPRRRKRVVRLGLVALAVVVLAAGLLGAFALPGKAAEGGGVTISGNVPALLAPGNPAQALDLAFSNPNDDVVSFSSLTVTIGTVDAPNATSALPCSTADYAVTQFTGSSPLSLPPGSSTLQSLGYPSSAWPTIRMLETGKNQDGCEGATVILDYSGSGQDGPATTTTSTTTSTSTSTTTTTTTTTTNVATTSSTTTTAPFVPPSLTAKKPMLTISPATQTIASGGKAKFTITVKNSSGVKLTGVSVGDPAAPNCSRSIGAMAAGATSKYTCSRAGVKASFTDVATMSGKTSSGSTVSVSTSAKVKIKAPFVPPTRPALKIRITPATQTVVVKVAKHKAGSGATAVVYYPTAHFTIKVTDIGNVALKAVTVRDPLAKACDRKLGTIAAGHSRTFRCASRGVTAGFTNVATVSGKAANGKQATASARATVKVKTNTGVTVTKNKSGTTVTLSLPDVLFAFNKSTLGPGANRPLMTVLRYVTKTYHGHLTITGFTDDIGTVTYNLGLSHRRAETVTRWLERHGVPASRITTRWKGEADPIASNSTAAGRQKNRRVTIAVRTGKP